MAASTSRNERTIPVRRLVFDWDEGMQAFSQKQRLEEGASFEGYRQLRKEDNYGVSNAHVCGNADSRHCHCWFREVDIRKSTSSPWKGMKKETVMREDLVLVMLFAKGRDRRGSGTSSTPSTRFKWGPTCFYQDVNENIKTPHRVECRWKTLRQRVEFGKSYRQMSSIDESSQ